MFVEFYCFDDHEFTLSYMNFVSIEIRYTYISVIALGISMENMISKSIKIIWLRNVGSQSRLLVNTKHINMLSFMTL